MTETRIDRRRRGRVSTAIGVVFILSGLSMLGYVGWQYFGTNIVSKQKQAEVKKAVVLKWDKGIDGDAIGLLRVPRFGENFEVPILPTFSRSDLAKGVGAYEDGAMPGEIGNFAVAGHRVTHGEPFRDFLKLRKGDEVYVETRTHIYTYVLRENGDKRTLDFTQGWVLLPNPIARNFMPEKPILTLLTCSELFHTRNRNIVFGDLTDTVTK